MATLFQTYGIDDTLPELLGVLAAVGFAGELAALPAGGARQAALNETTEARASADDCQGLMLGAIETDTILTSDESHEPLGLKATSLQLDEHDIMGLVLARRRPRARRVSAE